MSTCLCGHSRAEHHWLSDDAPDVCVGEQDVEAAVDVDPDDPMRGVCSCMEYVPEPCATSGRASGR